MRLTKVDVPSSHARDVEHPIPIRLELAIAINEFESAIRNDEAARAKDLEPEVLEATGLARHLALRELIEIVHREAGVEAPDLEARA